MNLVQLNLIRSIVGKYLGYDFKNRKHNKTRVREFVEARMIYFYLCRNFLNLPLADIGKTIYPKKDHATVLHGYRTIQNLIQFDKQKALIVDDLTSLVGRALTDLENSGDDMLSYEQQILKIDELQQEIDTLKTKFQDEIDTLRRENIKILERLNKFRKSLNAHKKYLNDVGYDLNKSKTFKLLDVNTI